MARLRDPNGGCPWDLEQDFTSISPHTIEEAYEVDEAIASGDLEALRDELGDLLFQVVFQARLAEEEGAFDFGGVVSAIVEKLIRRHPHVFAGSETPDSVEAQLANWEQIKAAERAASGDDEAGPVDPFVGIPRSLPALARSAKLAGRIERLHSAADGAAAGPSGSASRADPVSRVGDAAPGALASIRATLDALSRHEESDAAQESAATLVGQGLRAWVALARSLGVDPEQALRRVDDAEIASVRANRIQASAVPIR